jgi:hypothetical protein
MNKQELKQFVKTQLDANPAATDSEILSAVPASTTALGRIQGADKLDLVTIVIGGGLDDRCDAMIAENLSPTHVEVATKIKKALDPVLLMSEQYWINLGVPQVKALMDAALSVGLLVQEEYDGIVALATYVTDDTSWVTLADIAGARSELEKEALQANPTVVECTNPGDAAHIVKIKASDIHTVTVTVQPEDAVPYTCKMTVTAKDKNLEDTEYVEDTKVRGVLVLPAGFSGSRRFQVNHTGLGRHIKYIVSSEFNKPFTATVETRD